MPQQIQQLRTPTATKLPSTLLPGQIAFNLANRWVMVGDGSGDITVDGTVLAYGTSATVLGVTSVVIPAKPAAGAGYYVSSMPGAVSTQIDKLSDYDPTVIKGGVDTFTTGAVAGAVGGSASAPQAYSGIATTSSGSGVGAIFTASVTGATAATFFVEQPGSGYANGDTITIPAGSLGTGSAAVTLTLTAVEDRFRAIPTGAGVVVRDPSVTAGQPGAYKVADFGTIADIIPWATSQTASGIGGVGGKVLLARITDLLETGSPLQTTPDPHAVPSAAQFKQLVDRVGGLLVGHVLLGTYTAAGPAAAAIGIASVTPPASAGGRTGLVVGGKISGAGVTGVQPGDYFVVSEAGTIAGETQTSLNVAVKAGDQLLFDGQEWRHIPIASAGGDLLHTLGDVNDAPVPGIVETLPAVTNPPGTLTDGTYAVDPTGGAGSGLRIRIVVASNAVSRVELLDGGTGYQDGDTLTIPTAGVPGSSGDGSMTLTAANLRVGYAASIQSSGILVRDPSIADGLPGAFRLVGGLDAGTY